MLRYALKHKCGLWGVIDLSQNKKWIKTNGSPDVFDVDREEDIASLLPIGFEYYYADFVLYSTSLPVNNIYKNY